MSGQKVSNSRLEQLFAYYPFALLIFSLLYFITGELGLLLQSEQTGLTLVWPASGLAFVLLFRFGKKLWPGIILGMFLLGLNNNIPIIVASIAGIGSVAEAIIALQIFKRAGVGLGRLNGVLLFTMAAGLGPLFSATLGTFAFHNYGDADVEPWVTWLFWWLGNSIGILVVGSFLLSHIQKEMVFQPFSLMGRMSNWSLSAMAGVMIGIYIFSLVWVHNPLTTVLLFTALPIAALLGLSTGTRFICHANFSALSALIIVGHVWLPEHFQDCAITDVYTHVAFLGILAFTGLLFAAMQRELKEKESLDYASSHDGLTGLYNRRYFNQQLEHALDTVKRTSSVQHALIFIDLDHFKEINDSEGHAAGDEMLILCARAIVENIRKRDCASRWGGDEFATLLWYCPTTHAQQIAENIRCAILAQNLVLDGQEYRVTASAGLLIIDESHDSFTELLKKVDEASYRAKRAGGNRVVLVEPV
jgi:diguanylate cyclase (GGDEF)-like protein